MRKLYFLMILLSLINYGYGEQRLALIIGNAAYDGNALRNPVNDAADLSAVLRNLGFQVTLKQDVNQRQMEEAVNQFSGQVKSGDIALFFYSGHGSQVNGENYLIPVKETIASEADCKYKAVNANWVVEKLERARLNIIILDACRDNPFRGVRSGNKGMAAMSAKPGGTYIVFATATGQTAADGQERNSPFTASLLKNLTLPDTKIEDIIKQVTLDVMQKTSNQQVPWISGNLIEDFYFISSGVQKKSSENQPRQENVLIRENHLNEANRTNGEKKSKVEVETIELTGALQITCNLSGDVYLDDDLVCSISPGEKKILRNIKIGDHILKIKTKNTENTKSIQVALDQTMPVHFEFLDFESNLVFVEGGTFQMGSNDGGSDEKPVHTVTVSSFYMGKYEVTQKEWMAIMGSNPSNWKGDNLPVENVSWNDVQEFIRRLNEKTGGNYRLPTEAEWEYAARGGAVGARRAVPFKYAGSDIADAVAWYSGNSGNKTHSVGQNQPNELGIYDMSGNVWEWCQDWYSDSYYSGSPGNNPQGPVSGTYRVLRGGSWDYSEGVLRSANRDGGKPGGRNFSLGFRCVRSR